MTAAQVLSDYAAGRRDFQEVDISDVDLSNHDLRAASFLNGHLTRVNLSGCNLTYVQLKNANVSGANLSRAALNATDLIGADFADCLLSRSDLTGASLARANLRGADLSRSSLGSTDFALADLTAARLTGAHLYHTVLCDVDVSAFCDEPRLDHGGHSYIDYRTVVKSYRHPGFRQFMLDCVVPGIFAEYMLDCARAVSENLLKELMQSTFISYGAPDEGFARRLYDELKTRGVVTFFFPQTATFGARIGDEVYRGISSHDRVLLVCSRDALDRPGVVNEIQETLDREARDGGATYLLPISLDDYVFEGWHEKQPMLAERVRNRVVGNFQGAMDDKEKFDSALSRLVDALKKRRP